MKIDDFATLSLALSIVYRSFKLKKKAMNETFQVIPPTTKVFCPERGEGWTLTGITALNENTSVMFNGVRYTLPAQVIVEQLLPNYRSRQQS
ncbi:putative orphan protein [Pseudoalteromonas luteoviolacea B = ATCC 29581]|nr:putative orphan protein [Pseudoalteromonas luteoviolacea B = ATCC 29581]